MISTSGWYTLFIVLLCLNLSRNQPEIDKENESESDSDSDSDSEDILISLIPHSIQYDDLDEKIGHLEHHIEERIEKMKKIIIYEIKSSCQTPELITNLNEEIGNSTTRFEAMLENIIKNTKNILNHYCDIEDRNDNCSQNNNDMLSVIKTEFGKFSDRNQQLLNILNNLNKKNQDLENKLDNFLSKEQSSRAEIVKKQLAIDNLNVQLSNEKEKNNNFNIELNNEKAKNNNHNVHLNIEREKNDNLNVQLNNEKEANNNLNVQLNNEEETNNKLKVQLNNEKVTNMELTRKFNEAYGKLSKIEDKLGLSGKQQNYCIISSVLWKLAKSKESNGGIYVWKPTSEEISAGKLHVQYSSSRDQYFRPVGKQVLKGWNNGIYEMDSFFRMVEHDYQTTYLARQENTKQGTIKWKFALTGSGKYVDTVRIRFSTTIFNSGKVESQLCSFSECIAIPREYIWFETTYFQGVSELEIISKTSQDTFMGAQLFRQKLEDVTSYPFDITITLRNCDNTFVN